MKEKRKDLLKDHVKVKHVRIKCEQCDYHTEGKVNLRKHIISDHFLEPGEVCTTSEKNINAI